MLLFVALLIVRQSYTALSGHPAIICCGRDPAGPVKWTCQHSSDSAVKDVTSSYRYGLRDSCLVIDSVQAADSGTYNCTDAAGKLHAVQLHVLGKLCFFVFHVVNYTVQNDVQIFNLCLET